MGAGPGNFSRPYSIDFGPNGTMAVADSRNDRIQVFRANGTFDFEFGSLGAGPGEFNDPFGVAFGPNGTMAVADSRNDRIQVFRANGTFDYQIGPEFLGYVAAGSPTGVAAGPNGTVAVSEYFNHTVRVYHANGTLDYQLGSEGMGPGNFSFPSGVAFGPNGTMAVADAGNRRIQVFDANGTFDFEFGKRGTMGPGNFSFPSGVAFGPGGIMAVADRGGGAVQVFHPNGTFARWVGSSEGLGCVGACPVRDGPGEFHGPSRVAFGPGGIIAVADTFNDRIQAFHPNGTFDFEFGSEGTGHGEFNDTSSVAFGPGGIMAVADRDNHRIQAFHPNGTFAYQIGYDEDEEDDDGDHHGHDHGSEGQGDGPGEFNLPLDVAFGPGGIMAVADTGNQRVQVFYLPSWGDWVPFEADSPPAPPADGGNGTATPPPDVGPPPDGNGGPGQPPPPVVVPLPPAAVVPPLQPIIVPLNGTGPSQVNVTAVGHAANLTIDVAGLADSALDGTASSTVTFPPSETIVAASFATVSFPPNVTASHVPADGRLALRVAADVPDAEQVQGALAYEGSGNVTLRRVVEVGGGGPGRVVFDMPVRIFLEGQAGGRAFYIDGADGAITPIDAACAADDAARVHVHLGGAGECQIDSADGGKVVYTYHLTRFGTVLPANAAALPPTTYTCAVGIGESDLGVRMAPGEYSAPVRQTIINQGSLPFERVGLDATPWRVVPGAGGPPQDGGLLATEVAVVEGAYDALSEGTAVAHGLGGGVESTLWFRVLAGSGLQDGTLAQDLTYRAECAGP